MTGKKRKPPELFRCSDDELEAFWAEADPAEVDNLGDHLLAESLPRWDKQRAPYRFQLPAGKLRELREQAGLSRPQVAERLGLNPELVEAWEEDRLRIPGSLYLIYQKLKG